MNKYESILFLNVNADYIIASYPYRIIDWSIYQGKNCRTETESMTKIMQLSDICERSVTEWVYKNTSKR